MAFAIVGAMSTPGLDEVRFAVSAIPFDRADLRGGEDVVFTFVNGRDLLKVVEEFERPLAIEAGFSPTSSYAPVRASDVLPPSGHWLWSPDPDLSLTDWSVVFTCGCGDWGCGGLLARVEVGDEVVSWSDFQTPYALWRMAESPERPVRADISREGLGPFRFDRAKYEAALKRPERIVWPNASSGDDPHSTESTA
jgi:hypothetical protein